MRNRNINSNKTQKIETTFGEITIFKNEIKKELTKEQGHEPILDLKKHKVEVEVPETCGNFFGFEETKEKSKDSQMNFIDEQFFSSSQNKETEKSSRANSEVSISKENISKEKNLNYIDQYYFVAEDKTEKTSNKNLKNVTKKEINEAKDLNYIDELSFKENDESDQSLGSAVNYLNTKSEKQKPNRGEIPIIRSTKMVQDDDQNKNTIKAGLEMKSSSKEKKFKESNHKELLKDIPNWEHLTIDQGALILQKNICYFNEERKKKN